MANLLQFHLLLLHTFVTINKALAEKVCSSSVCLPENYNKMDLPPTSGPVIVNTTIILIDIFEVHPETFTLDLSLYIKLAWVDNRIELSNGSVNVDQSFMGLVWKPDMYIWDLNGEQPYSDMITMRSLTITSNAADVFVIYVMEIDVNIVWPMDFSRFPFDTNHIEFKLSAFTFHDYKVLFLTNSSASPDSQTNKAKIRDYKIAASYLREDEQKVGSWEEAGKFYSVPGIRISLTTRPEKFLWVYYVPAALFTITSWFSFLLPPTAYPARTALLVTVFLCQIGIFNGVIRETPNANGALTALEIWCLAMIGIVFLTLFAYAAILVQLMVSGDKRNWKIELGMFLIVLILTTIFLVIYVIVEIY